VRGGWLTPDSAALPVIALREGHHAIPARRRIPGAGKAMTDLLDALRIALETA